MNTGKLVRLNRIFSHASQRLCSIAVDHLMIYGQGMPAGLRHLRPTLAAIVAARPDAITMHKGMAATLFQPYAGRIPLILQATLGRPDGTTPEVITTAEDAVRLGADALAVAAWVRGPSEAAYLRFVSDHVREAARFELPVICHIYPRDLSTEDKISFAPEDIAWAARCAVETGVDVVKVPYCGDIAAYAEIVSDCPVPLVAAGGPQAGTLQAALTMMEDVIEAGARGATIGRNVWGVPHISQAIRAFKAVIHDGKTAPAALEAAGVEGS